LPHVEQSSPEHVDRCGPKPHPLLPSGGILVILSRAESSLAFWAFALTLFLSSALMFLVEPMVAKMVLPILGGTPMIWNTCMVFFQLVLLAGYGSAWGLSRVLRGWKQQIVHGFVLIAPVSTLPFAIRAGSAPPAGDNPTVWLLGLLGATIGLPFLALSTVPSLLQYWFSQAALARGRRDPYTLYAASNLGSFVALFAYPTVVEPFLKLHDQSRFWAAGYATLIAAVVLCAWLAHRRMGRVFDPVDSRPAIPVTGERRPDRPRRLKWIALAAVPSSLMLAVTNYLSTDLAAIPLLWVIPL